MPTIEIEASRTVHYSANIEVTEEQAARYQEAFNNQDYKGIQEFIESWIDVHHDVVDAERFDILNTSIDGEPLYL